MRYTTAIAAALALSLLVAAGHPAAQQDGISVFFSPHGGCEDAMSQQIANAQRSVDVQAYSFTSAPIAKALLRAHERGVVVRVLLDSSQATAQYSSATFFANQGIPIPISRSVGGSTSPAPGRSITVRAADT